ncbi:MAG: hypothetical protein L3J70_02985 [Gammaproteobacteria bacterium]|nr:hypothetical protein [Gammaproteobacteria bacterium]
MNLIQKMITKVVFSSIVVFCFLFSSATLKAAEWSLLPALGFAEEYGENAALLPGVKDRYFRLIAIPSLEMVRKDRNTELSLRTFLDFKYSKNNDLSDNSQRAYLKYTYQLERNVLGVNGTFKREGVLRKIAAEVNYDDIEASDLEDADTSILQVYSRRTLFDVKPYWVWRLSLQDTLKLQYRLLDTKYSTDSLFDHRTQRLSANWVHQLTQKMDSVLSFSGSQYKNLDNDSVVDNRQVNLGVNYKFSERFKGSAQIGFRNSSSESEDSSGVIYQIIGNKRTEIGSLNLLLRRNVNSSGKETSILADELKFWWKRKIRPTVDFSLYLNTYQNKNLADGSSSQVYFGLQPRFIWQLSLDWAMDFSYEFRRFKDNSAVAKSNSVAIGVRYAWPKVSVSR